MDLIQGKELFYVVKHHMLLKELIISYFKSFKVLNIYMKIIFII